MRYYLCIFLAQLDIFLPPMERMPTILVSRHLTGPVDIKKFVLKVKACSQIADFTDNNNHNNNKQIFIYRHLQENQNSSSPQIEVAHKIAQGLKHITSQLHFFVGRFCVRQEMTWLRKPHFMLPSDHKKPSQQQQHGYHAFSTIHT